MKMRTDVPVVFTVDGKERTKVWLDWALKSLREVLGDDVKVYVCSNSAEDCRKGFGYGSVAVDVSEVIRSTDLSKLENLKYQGRVRGPMQVFRLALPIVPELMQYEKFVYLDADVEFRSPKWARIFDIDLGDKEVGMAEDGWPVNSPAHCESMRVFQDVCGICCDEARERLRHDVYYGAGLVVFNERKLLERGNYQARMADMLEAMIRCEFRCPDQDALNYALTVCPLDQRFDAWDNNNPKGGEAWLWHYAGGAKFEGVYPPDWYRRIADHGKTRDILYVVNRDGERNLRYALRSLDKYGNGVGRVIVAGYPPDWLSDEVVKVPVEQPYESPYQNVLHTICVAIKEANISGHFLLGNDDFFLVRPTDMFNYPFYFRGWGIPDCKVGPDDQPGTARYKMMMNATRVALGSLGLPALDFGSHRFNHGHAEMVKDNGHRLFCTDVYELNVASPNGLWLREIDPPCVMQNLWLSLEPDLPLVPDRDFKIMSVPAGGLKYDLGIPNDRECISFDDVVWTDANFRAFVDREFGEPGRWEK